MEYFLGQILLFSGNFVPYGFVACNGQLLSANDYPELFSLLGATYGGDGHTTFGAPDLRGRVPIGVGTASGLSNRYLGDMGGEASVTLTPANLPAHSHELFGINSNADSATPGPSTMFGNGVSGQILPYNDVTLAAGIVQAFSDKSITPSAGGGNAHENRMPSVGMQYIMVSEGIFPST